MAMKDMRRSDWSRILSRRYASRPCRFRGREGRVSLLVIEEAAEPLIVRDAGEELNIVERGYAWVQIAMKDQPFWLTAMFDERGELLQIYFDITGGNRFDDPENPTFEDMYLDIVVNSRGELYVLDRDELDAALTAGAITQAQHDRAERACQTLYQYLKKNRPAVQALCRRAYRELKALL